jgi:hypothetical protein
MSASAFRQVLNKIPEMKFWASGKKDTSSILHQTRDSTKAEVRKSDVEHIIPLEQLTEIVGKDIATSIFKEVKSGKYDITGFEQVTYQNIQGQETITFHKVNFDRLNKDISLYLNSIAQNASAISNTDDSVYSKVLEYASRKDIDKGHVFGWANTLVNRTKASIGKTLSSRNVPKEQLELELNALNSFIDNLLDVLEEYDKASSNIKGLDGEIFAKYRKTSSNWITEWQIKSDNIAAGNIVAAGIGKGDRGVRGFLKNVGLGSSKSLIDNALNGIVEGFLGEVDLSKLQSSPALVDMIHDDLYSALSGNPKKYEKTYTGIVNNLPKLKFRKVITTGVKDSVSSSRNVLRNLKTKVDKAKRDAQSAKYTVSSSINLLAILQAGINKQVAKNMGKGNEHRVLNYRTGRFAESVQVQRLSESRQGMISAFYSYMRNPYGTFSEGGRQQFPKIRDPKLLISKSVRELAAPIVGARMRAVLV